MEVLMQIEPVAERSTMRRVWLAASIVPGLILVVALLGVGAALHVHNIDAYNSCVGRQADYPFKWGQSIAPMYAQDPRLAPCVRHWP
jgi:hypothetical protein